MQQTNRGAASIPEHIKASADYIQQARAMCSHPPCPTGTPARGDKDTGDTVASPTAHPASDAGTPSSVGLSISMSVLCAEDHVFPREGDRYPRLKTTGSTGCFRQNIDQANGALLTAWEPFCCFGMIGHDLAPRSATSSMRSTQRSFSSAGGANR